MPKILPELPAAPTPTSRASIRGADFLAPSPRTSSRSDRSGGFDDVLNGARSRTQRSEPESSERAEKPAPKSEKTKAAKPKPRAERKQKEKVERPDDAVNAESESDSTVQDVAEPVDSSNETQPEEEQGAETEDTLHRVKRDENEGEEDTQTDGFICQAVDVDAAIEAAASAGLPVDETIVDAEAVDVKPEAGDEAVATPQAAITVDPTLAAAAAQLGEIQGTSDALVHDASLDESAVAGVPDALASVAQGGRTVAKPVSPAHAGKTAPDEIESDLKTKLEAKDVPKPAATANAAQVVEELKPDAAATAPVPAHDTAAASPDASAAARAVEALGSHQAKSATAPTSTISQPAIAPEAQFAEDNHDTIVAGVRGQLMPNGGTMRIRLDPPELGPLAITVRLHNGVMEASFEASSEEAAKLLSHSLSSLKTSLESQGMNVERLHVQQAPKIESSNSNNGNSEREGQQGQNRDNASDHPARQEHQRREMLRRMWRKLTGTEDPLDMVA